jgi:hypothetical protein
VNESHYSGLNGSEFGAVKGSFLIAMLNAVHVVCTKTAFNP